MTGATSGAHAGTAQAPIRRRTPRQTVRGAVPRGFDAPSPPARATERPRHTERCAARRHLTHAATPRGGIGWRPAIVSVPSRTLSARGASKHFPGSRRRAFFDVPARRHHASRSVVYPSSFIRSSPSRVPLVRHSPAVPKSLRHGEEIVEPLPVPPRPVANPGTEPFADSRRSETRPEPVEPEPEPEP